MANFCAKSKEWIALKDIAQDEPCWIGIDGTREGWSVCILQTNGNAELRFISDLEKIWSIRKPENIRAIGIDMPLALAQKAERGGRNCEREGRKILTAARKNAIIHSKEQDDPNYNNHSEGPFVGPSSIFTPPSRPALEKFERGGTHAEVSEANIRSAFSDSSDTDQNRKTKRQKTASKEESGLGLSIQTFNIMQKILELDRFVVQGIEKNCLQFLPPKKDEASNGKTFLFECHPELAFLSCLANHKEGELENQQAVKAKKLLYGRTKRMEILNNLPLFKNFDTDQKVFKGLHDGETTFHALVFMLQAKLTNWIFPFNRVKSDDVIDSMICATTAKRFDMDKVIEIGVSSAGGQRELDFRGVPMSIFV